MWIVMTSSAKSNSCWGQYRNVALVHINQEYTANGKTPKLISERARGVVRLSTMRSAVIHMGHFHYGHTLSAAPITEHLSKRITALAYSTTLCRMPKLRK